MRRLCCALAVLGGLMSPAAAQDFPLLRGTQTVGPATFTRWSGFYLGGQFGVGDSSADFSHATGPGIDATLQTLGLTPSQWMPLGTGNKSAISYGGFLGYNAQWQDLILGVEANFNRATLQLNAPSTLVQRSLSGTESLTLTSSGSMTNFDFGTFRARAGYVIGDFLPYGFLGMALGLANVSVVSTLTCAGAGCPTTVTFPFTSSAGGNMEVLYGFAVGGGVDVLLTPNIFVRAEFEFDQFIPPPNISMWIATGRLGAGLLF